MRTKHRCQAQCANGDAGALANIVCNGLKTNSHTTELGGRVDGCRFVGASKRTTRSAVDRSSTAKHDVLERWALGCSTKERRCRLLRIGNGMPGVDSGIGLPHGNVDHHMRVEPRHDIDNMAAIVRIDSMKHCFAQTAARRIDIDPFELANPWLSFEHRGHERTKFATHASDQNAAPFHQANDIGAGSCERVMANRSSTPQDHSDSCRYLL